MAETGRRFSSAVIEPQLPSDFGDGDDVSFLRGATILRAGTLTQNDQQFLAIEFQKAEGPKLLLLGFSELGLWIAPY